MTPALVEKIKQLVAAGATVLGPRPTASPSLSDYPKCDEEVARLAAEIWGDCDGKTVTEHAFGKGRVIWGQPLDRSSGTNANAAGFHGDVKLNWIHRQVGDLQIYFVANEGRSPWRPMQFSGERFAAGIMESRDRRNFPAGSL